MSDSAKELHFDEMALGKKKYYRLISYKIT